MWAVHVCQHSWGFKAAVQHHTPCSHLRCRPCSPSIPLPPHLVHGCSTTTACSSTTHISTPQNTCLALPTPHYTMSCHTSPPIQDHHSPPCCMVPSSLRMAPTQADALASGLHTHTLPFPPQTLPHQKLNSHTAQHAMMEDPHPTHALERTLPLAALQGCRCQPVTGRPPRPQARAP